MWKNYKALSDPLSHSGLVFFIILGVQCRSHNFSSQSSPAASSRTDVLIFRRLAFPPKTFLIFVPELTLPIWRDRIIEKKEDHHLSCGAMDTKEGTEEGLQYAVKNSDIQISSPFYVYFDKLGLTHEHSIFNTPSHVSAIIQEYLVNPALHIFGVPPPTGKEVKREKRKDTFLSDSHRLQLFHKIEQLLEETGLENGRSCLLRAICELHEFPFDSGRYGIFGEVLALIFGALPLTQGNGGGVGGECLSIYARAEKYGKARDCTRYVKFCKQSVFQWYWKFPYSKLRF